MTPNDILDLKMIPNDAKAETIRDYFKALLQEVWKDGEGFNGKRPFGNSGWERELYHTLAHHGVVKVQKDDEDDDDDDFYLEDYDEADKIIQGAIDAL